MGRSLVRDDSRSEGAEGVRIRQGLTRGFGSSPEMTSETVALALRSIEVLAAGDEDLGAGDVAEVRRAEAEHRGRHLFRLAHAVQRNARDQGIVLLADHRRPDTRSE